MLLIVFENYKEFYLFFQNYHQVNIFLTDQKMYPFCKSDHYCYY